jgi:hypothetical protein
MPLATATPWDSIDPQDDAVAEANEQSAAAVEMFIDEFYQPVPCKPQTASGGGGWSIPLLCIGIAILACCLIVPAADENRRLTFEHEKLRIDLEQLHKQISVNDEFLQRVGNDPTLTQRLAQRQMKMLRQGTSVLDVKGASASGSMSPFLLTSIPPPPAVPEYRPLAGKLSALCLAPKPRLYMIGGGLLCVAVGLVVGKNVS